MTEQFRDGSIPAITSALVREWEDGGHRFAELRCGCIVSEAGGRFTQCADPFGPSCWYDILSSRPFAVKP